MYKAYQTFVFICLIGVVFGVVSCSENKTNKTVELNNSIIPDSVSSVDTVVNESIQKWDIKGPIIDTLLKDKFTRVIALPFRLDTNHLKLQSGTIITDEKLFAKSDSTLNYKELNQLRSNMFFAENQDYHTYFLDKAEEITKMSRSSYEAYLAQLDIGQTKVARAFSLGKITLSDSTTLLIWYVKHNTFEACPYGFGMMYYATLITSDHIQGSYPIAEHTGGGDPPVSSSLLVDFVLHPNGKFTQHYTHEINDEFPVDDGGYVLKNKVDRKKYMGSFTRDSILFKAFD